MNFTKGDRVRHPGKPEWDMGQVLEDCAGGDVRVYFTGAGEKKLRLDYVTLERVEGDAAANPVLDSLGKRQPRTAAAGAKRGKKIPKTRAIAQLAEDFTRLYPGGFRDDKFEREEREGKVKAHETLTGLLGREQIDALVAAGEHGEVCRHALRVISETNLVFPREAISLKNGLKDEANQRLFAESLRALLYGDAEVGSRFAAFCDLLAGMGAAKWPLATYFPFVAFPEREMFLKPTVTRKVAEMLGAELNYSVEPNWLTYSKLIELSRHVFDSLAELGPRDMFDIQSFISRVAGYEEGEAADDETAAHVAAKPPTTRAARTTEVAGDEAGESRPPWTPAATDAASEGAAEPPDEPATSSEAASVSAAAVESDEAAREPSEASEDGASEDEASDDAAGRAENSADAGSEISAAHSEPSERADAQPEPSERAGAQSESSDNTDAARAQSSASEELSAGAPPEVDEVPAGKDATGAADEGREGAAADEGRGGAAAAD